MNVVLTYLRTLPENEDLPFQLLSHKVAMLMALANADRCVDLAVLDLDINPFRRMGLDLSSSG